MRFSTFYVQFFKKFCHQKYFKSQNLFEKLEKIAQISSSLTFIFYDIDLFLLINGYK